ncbi:TraB/GumN family protein [Paracoccus aerodenitrificans]|uniref:TraB/GumN family protein n=1 Tax=Paracoccus aerodenitrificans TaxID=3017781 RepID=UPI0022F0CAD1|nr:TraB/GumN family protein [Paracoccus aerodenitrificans]WBU63109.1 TraB/GumN family protein [Paracoccus aerodenitrificans]
MKRLFAALSLCLAAPAAFAQQCAGDNLIAALPEADRAEISRRTEAVPYTEGLFWRAEKGGDSMILIGTFHFDHPLHSQVLERFGQDLANADALLVEMGPEEQAQLQQAMIEDPSLMMQPDGPTLPERLSDAQWQQLSGAMEDRGIPAVMVSKMRPWYAATMMGLSPCMMREMAANGGEMTGLDWQLVKAATQSGTRIKALEPWDTVLKMFGQMTPEEQIEMIVYSLPAAAHADDYAATMIDAYADQSVWPIWEFGRIDAYSNTDLSRDEVDEMTAEAQELLMDDRNRSWIGPLTKAAEAAGGEGIVAAFGALHLPGENGVLRLLEKDGWSIERLSL